MGKNPKRSCDKPKNNISRVRVMFHATIPFMVIVCIWCGTHLTLRTEIVSESTVMTAATQDFYNIRIERSTVYCVWCTANIGRTCDETNTLLIIRRYRRVRVDPVSIITSCKKGSNSPKSDLHSHTMILATVESEPSMPVPQTNLRTQAQLNGPPFRTKCKHVIDFFGFQPSNSSSQSNVFPNLPLVPISFIDLSNSSDDGELAKQKKTLKPAENKMETALKNSLKCKLCDRTQTSDAEFNNFLEAQPSTSSNVYEQPVNELIRGRQLHVSNTPTKASSTQPTIEEDILRGTRIQTLTNNITIDDPVAFFRAYCANSSNEVDPEISFDIVADTLRSRGTSMDLIKTPPNLSKGQCHNVNLTNEGDIPLNLSVSGSSQRNVEKQIVILSNESIPVNRLYDLPVVLADDSATNVQPIQANVQNHPTNVVPLTVNNEHTVIPTLGSIINNVVDYNYPSQQNSFMPNTLAPVTTTSLTYSSNSIQNFTTSTPCSNFSTTTNTNNCLVTTSQPSTELYDLDVQNSGNPPPNHCYYPPNYNASFQDFWSQNSATDQTNLIDSAPNYVVGTQDYMPTFGSSIQTNAGSSLPHFSGAFANYVPTYSTDDQSIVDPFSSQPSGTLQNYVPPLSTNPVSVNGSNVPENSSAEPNFVPASDATNPSVLNSPFYADFTQNIAPMNGSNARNDNPFSDFSSCSENSRN